MANIQIKFKKQKTKKEKHIGKVFRGTLENNFKNKFSKHSIFFFKNIFKKMVTKQQLTFYLNVFTLDLLIGFLFYSYHYGSHFGNFYF